MKEDTINVAILKKALFVLVMIFIALPVFSQLPKDTTRYQQCRVKKIKKTENAYIIYVKVPEIVSKGTIAVVSPYCPGKGLLQLKRMKRYELSLVSYFNQYIVWKHHSFYDLTINDVKIRLKEDGTIRGMVFYSPNLCGLYYETHK